MGSRIVCCFVLYSAFDSKIMQLANRRLTFPYWIMEGLPVTRQLGNPYDKALHFATSVEPSPAAAYSSSTAPPKTGRPPREV